ncbi:unnamed protein product [Dimorphilus gyrociliatus]|uniref:Uncharacterized protein n=1 Tax=Dimorphilus gyrociliatus TaxID=2664684 RepID=A0A7I8WE44_9ANNE|nr:unnamed protein product [Dimorphilus gyrociliatus]
MSNVAFLTSIEDTNPNNINSFTLCNQGSVGSMQSLTVDCLNGPQYSKLTVVKLESVNKKLTISEIEIWTMRDIDRNKLNVLPLIVNEQTGNDGQSFSSWEDPFCSWTGSIVPSWWVIDLEIESEIYAVSLVNRNYALERLSQSKIIISNNVLTNPPWQPEILCNTIDDATLYMTRRCPKYTIGRYLALFKPSYVSSSGNGLTICEIEIFGSTLNDTAQFTWIINSSSSTIQINSRMLCNNQNVQSIEITQYKSKIVLVEVKGILLSKSCKNDAVKLIASRGNNMEECQLEGTLDGYYSQYDIL